MIKDAFKITTKKYWSVFKQLKLMSISHKLETNYKIAIVANNLYIPFIAKINVFEQHNKPLSSIVTSSHFTLNFTIHHLPITFSNNYSRIVHYF